MSWKLNSAGDACVSCDHPECTAEIVHWLEKDDHAAASESAMAARPSARAITEMFELQDLTDRRP